MTDGPRIISIDLTHLVVAALAADSAPAIMPPTGPMWQE